MTVNAKSRRGMRVSVLSITGGGMSGGYAKHIGRLVPLLARHPDVTSLQLIRPKATRFASNGHPPEVVSNEVSRFYAPASRRPSRELMALLDEFEPDVLFIPNFRALFTNRWPVVAMVRNMETLDWNDANDPIKHRIATRLRRIEGRLAVRAAQRLIAVSGYVRDFLVDNWGVNPEKVSMVYHGVDNPDDFPQLAVRPTTLPNEIARFLFTAGSTKPSRGLEDLFAALAQLPDPRPPLVVAGHAEPPFEGYEHELRRVARRISNGASIVWAGLLAPTSMAWCYQHTELFVMTSRVEACPNIALEAMSFGSASVAANNRPLPEIFGDAAEYYEPRQPQSLAAQVSDLTKWPTRRAALSNAARLRAQTFSWNRCAEETAQALALAISSWHRRTQTRF